MHICVSEKGFIADAYLTLRVGPAANADANEDTRAEARIQVGHIFLMIVKDFKL